MGIMRRGMWTTLVGTGALLALGLLTLATPFGTRLVLQKIAQETGFAFYGIQGTILTGIEVAHIQSTTLDTFDVELVDAQMRLGLGALLSRQLHITHISADTLRITDQRPKDDTPFDYTTHLAPIALQVDVARAHHIHYRRQDTDLILDGLDIQNLRWIGANVSLGQGALVINDDIALSNITGTIALTDDYPLDAFATLQMDRLARAHIGALHIRASDTLKDVALKAVGQYKGQPISGVGRISPLEDAIPFDATLKANALLLPYAPSQGITLTDTRLRAQGYAQTTDIRLTLDTQLDGKDIPKGHYLVQGNLTQDALDIDQASLTNAQGTLEGTMHLNWADDFYMRAQAQSTHYPIVHLLGEAGAPALPYLPKILNGTVDFAYYDGDQNHYQIGYQMADGEALKADITQGQSMHIKTQLSQLKRPVAGLDAEITQANAHIEVSQGRIKGEAAGQLVHLASVPTGWYQGRFDVLTQGDIREISLTELELSNTQADTAYIRGNIRATLKGQDATWSGALRLIDAKGERLHPSLETLTNIQGHIHTTGHKTGTQIALSAHLGGVHAHLNDMPLGLGARVGLDYNTQTGALGGDIRADITTAMHGKHQTHRLDTSFLHADDILDIRRLNVHQDRSSTLGANGRILLGNGRTSANIRARFDGFSLGEFVPNMPLVLTGDARIQGAKTQAGFEGLSAYFEGDLTHPTLGGGAFVLDADAQGDTIHINRLTHIQDQGHLQAHGALDLTRRAFTGHLEAQDANLAHYLPAHSSALTGTLDIKARAAHEGVPAYLALEHISLAGTHMGNAVAASGHLVAQGALANTHKVQTYLDAIDALDAHLALSYGGNRIRLKGNKARLDAQFEASDLSLIAQGFDIPLDGQMHGTLALFVDAKTLYLDTKADHFTYGAHSLEHLVARGRVGLTGQNSHLTLEADGAHISGHHLDTARLVLTGTDANHSLKFLVDGAINAQGTLRGHYTNGAYRATLSEGALRRDAMHLTQDQDAHFAYVNGALDVSAHCWSGAGKVCLVEDMHYGTDGLIGAVEVQEVDVALFAPLMPDGMQWTGTLDGTIRAHIQKDNAPQIFVDTHLSQGNISQAGATMAYDTLALSVQTGTDGRLHVSGNVSGRTGRASAQVGILPQGRMPMTGTLVVEDVALDALLGTSAHFQALEGRINAQGALGGHLKAPRFFGNVHLTDGRLAMSGVPLALDNIDLIMAVNGNRANLAGSFGAGEGTGRIQGEIDPALNTRLDIQAEALHVAQAGLFEGQVSPDLTVVLKPAQKSVAVTGAVTLAHATIRPPAAQSDAVPLSSDVIVIDRRLTSTAAALLAQSIPWHIALDVGADIGEAVSFRGFGVVLPLAGALHLHQNGGTVVHAQGLVQVAQRKQVDIFGQPMRLNYAQVRFDGEVTAPSLSIEAVREIEGQTIGVGVSGSAQSPQITVFNDGGLSESQAMNALVTGSLTTPTLGAGVSQEGFRTQVNNHLAAAGLSLGLSGTRDFTNELGQAFGLQSLTLDAKGGPTDANLAITGYVTPDLYVRYGVGVFGDQNQWQARYQLTHNLYIEGASGLERAVDMVYRFEF